MPIKEFPGSLSWGYTPRYHFAVETSYGATYELKEMIDTFHKNGIRVIIDGVYNHVRIDMNENENVNFFSCSVVRRIRSIYSYRS